MDLSLKLNILYFRDAFHSLHRYLFFMEDENDEQSAYHPHDLAKYCQFCLDRLHPVTVERPFTVNPIIPLVDPIYDHVIKRQEIMINTHGFHYNQD